MLWNCGVGEDSCEFLGLQEEYVHPKGNQSWIFIGRIDTEAEAPILWPSHVKNWLTGKDPPKDWERLKAGEEGDDRGWEGWIASPTRWTWVWVNSGSWRWTGKTGVLQSMGSQRARHEWATELNGTELNPKDFSYLTHKPCQFVAMILYMTFCYVYRYNMSFMIVKGHTARIIL